MVQGIKEVIMNRNEKLLLLELGRELKEFLDMSNCIGRLSRSSSKMPTAETIAEHKMSGRNVINIFNKLVESTQSKGSRKQ
jgi:hypothetical protein